MVDNPFSHTRTTPDETYRKASKNALIKVIHQSRTSNSKKATLGCLDSDDDHVLRIFHQNICGIGSKTIDLLTSLYPNLPHILCLTEHHLRQFQLQLTTLDSYVLGTEYSRQSVLKGGGSVFLYKNLPFSIINIKSFMQIKNWKHVR
jgi:hypothetical protein